MIDVISHSKFFHDSVCQMFYGLGTNLSSIYFYSVTLSCSIVQTHEVSLHTLQSYISAKNLAHWLKSHHLVRGRFCVLLGWGCSLSLRACWSSWRMTCFLTSHSDASDGGWASKLSSKLPLPS